MSAPHRSIRIFVLGILGLTGGLFWLLRGPTWHAAPVEGAERFKIRRTSAEAPTNPPAARPAPPPAEAYPVPAELAGIDLLQQTAEEAHAKSWGCIECHKTVHDPHGKETLHLGCTDCHGGNAHATTKVDAHVHPIYRDAWNNSSANPVRSYTLLNHEDPCFIQFMNPGDLRIAHLSCGTASCHPTETLQVKKSMMTTGCMLWSAALYNNGASPLKRGRYGESYSMHGAPQRVQTVPPPTEYEQEFKGIVPYLEPLPRFQMSQPANLLRIFERGGRFSAAETGIPELEEESGRPRARLSIRGLGTGNRTDPVFIGLQKTRLLDPTLNFMGTNEQPGEYRNSGCTGCHVIYANDRSPVHSGPYAKYGHMGRAAAETDDLVTSVDPTIPKDESGHPVQHKFSRGMPSSQCIVCHIHPGTTVMNSYLGYMWWDEETDAELIYPEEEKHPTAEEFRQAQMSNPNESAVRNNLSDPEFLANLTDLNTSTKKTQFADFHGHGWAFRAVYKKNHQGTYLTKNGKELEEPSNEQFRLAVKVPEVVKELERAKSASRDKPADQQLWTQVEALKKKLEAMQEDVPLHMLDIHLEKGMHCVDCHFVQDVHGNTKLYQEVRAAVEIQCIDCHGTVNEPAKLLTSGPAAKGHFDEATQTWITEGRDLSGMRTPFGKRRFERRGAKLIQNSLVEKGLSWEVKQTASVVNPASEDYNALAALAKTVRWKDDTKTEYVWGDIPKKGDRCAHANDNMTCIACHSSWNPSCYGCHLPQKANIKSPDLHNEGDVTRNYISYNFQTLRDDVFMLARDGDVTSNRINPSRSSCAIHVGSYNGVRDSIYVQQQTISGEGYSGISFSTNVPHTVRGRGETKTCNECHLSKENDNNAVMAQLLMQGTNYLNFMGRYCWTACGEHGVFAPVVTERDEPQTVIGSSMHKVAFPERFKEHEENDNYLEHAHEHPGNDISENVTNVFKKRKKAEVLSVQLRGEYLYAACGEAGVRVFDVAFIDDKSFAERITTAPVSPFGQKFYVRTRYATSVASPTTIAPDPTRTHRPENKERPMHPLTAYIYATDLYEGLIMIGAGTLLDGDPANNFLKKDVAFNPGGILNGAVYVTIVGHYAYVCCDAGLVVVDIDDPTKPSVTHVLGHDFVHCPKMVQVQFRYGFLCDEQGIKILDTTDPARPVPVTAFEMEHAHSIYVARTYAYVAAGPHGLVILDVKNPEQPVIDQIFNAGGCINDLHDVKLGITYVSEFAYLADGKNGIRVVQLTSPETPGNDGFTPRPTPELIATYKLPHEGHALCISKAVDRDRAQDESGHQLAVFGRIGAGPLTLEEQHRMYLRQDGSVWKTANFSPDYSITDLKERERALEAAIESYYGPRRPFRLDTAKRPVKRTIERTSGVKPRKN